MAMVAIRVRRRRRDHANTAAGSERRCRGKNSRLPLRRFGFGWGLSGSTLRGRLDVAFTLHVCFGLFPVERNDPALADTERLRHFSGKLDHVVMAQRERLAFPRWKDFHAFAWL